MFIEEFPNGDGYWHLCFECGGSIGESQSLTIVDGIPFHTHCH